MRMQIIAVDSENCLETPLKTIEVEPHTAEPYEMLCRYVREHKSSIDKYQTSIVLRAGDEDIAVYPLNGEDPAYKGEVSLLPDRSEVLDTKAIAELLGYNASTAAAKLCRSGRLKTAKRYGNAWTAERWEVEEYGRSARAYIHDRANEVQRRQDES